MQTNDNFTEINKANYNDLYQSGKLFVQYPMDHVIRFHAYHLQYSMPNGRVLDFGCGSGNNSAFFMQKGYDVYGVDVAEECLDQIEANLRMYGLPPEHLQNFQIIDPTADNRRQQKEFAMTNLLDTHAVCEMLSISPATLRRAYGEGLIPQPIRVGRRGIRWRSSDLQEWIDGQAEISNLEHAVEISR